MRDKAAPDNALSDDEVQPGSRPLDGNFSGAYFDLHTTAGEQVLIKIAHGYSYQQAEARLNAEQPGWDFGGVRKQAQAA